MLGFRPICTQSIARGSGDLVIVGIRISLTGIDNRATSLEGCHDNSTALTGIERAD